MKINTNLTKEQIAEVISGSKKPKNIAKKLATKFPDFILVAESPISINCKQEFYRNTSKGLELISNDSMAKIIWDTLGAAFTKKKVEEVLYALKLEVSGLPGRCVKPIDIKSIAFADDPSLAWYRLKFSLTDLQEKPITIDDVPEFRDFLDRANDPTVIVLFIGSLLDPVSARHQYLHLRGDGDDGKSSILDMLAAVFGPRCVSLGAHEMNSPHFGEQLEGARLAVFRDENNSNFVSSGSFKQLTGDKYKTINPKHKPPKNIVLSVKVIITSNPQVVITGGTADTRRLLSVEFKKKETEWPVGWYDGLIKSAEKVMSYCYLQYLEALKNDPNIRKSLPANRENTEAAVMRGHEIYEDAFANAGIAITNKASDTIPRFRLHDIVLGKNQSHVSIQKFKDYLRQMGVTEGRPHGKNSYIGIKWTESNCLGLPNVK